MIRGKKVNNTLFGEELLEDNQEERLRGRNPELNAAKNEQILYRYHDYRRLNKYAFEWIVKELCAEFYLTESTIGQLIEDSAVKLQQIRNENLSTGELRKKYRFSVW